MMVHSAEQMSSDNSAHARRSAWPDFVPAEMAERFIVENQQTDKVVNAELEPIAEENQGVNIQSSIQ